MNGVNAATSDITGLTDRELALRYRPLPLFDRSEPFALVHLGYSVIRRSQPSKTFRRDIWLEAPAVLAIEYQLYYDFDIQHLYDLEHFWIWLAADGTVLDAEASEHGSRKNCFRLAGPAVDGTHLPVYVQPGKHAMMPRGELFGLYGNCDTVCNRLAGLDGLPVSDLFRGRILSTPFIDHLVCAYIRERYAFTPTWEFMPSPVPEEVVLPWEELDRIIPERIHGWVERITDGRA